MRLRISPHTSTGACYAKVSHGSIVYGGRLEGARQGGRLQQTQDSRRNGQESARNRRCVLLRLRKERCVSHRGSSRRGHRGGSQPGHQRDRGGQSANTHSHDPRRNGSGGEEIRELSRAGQVAAIATPAREVERSDPETLCPTRFLSSSSSSPPWLRCRPRARLRGAHSTSVRGHRSGSSRSRGIRVTIPWS